VTDSPLSHAAEVYAAFDRTETHRLCQYVADVEELVTSSFFAAGNHSVTISGSTDESLTTTLTYPGEEAVRAVVGIFRQLYLHHEPTSYHQILKLLGRHVHERDSSLRDAATAALRELRDWEKEVLKPKIALSMEHGAADGSSVQEDLTPAVLIDLFLHGKYLHKGNEKSDKLAAWPLAHLAQHTFMGTMVDLSQVYWVGANVVREVLKVPALVDRTSVNR
jgi:hypothetical protein